MNRSFFSGCSVEIAANMILDCRSEQINKGSRKERWEKRALGRASLEAAFKKGSLEKSFG